MFLPPKVPIQSLLKFLCNVFLEKEQLDMRCLEVKAKYFYVGACNSN